MILIVNWLPFLYKYNKILRAIKMDNPKNNIETLKIVLNTNLLQVRNVMKIKYGHLGIIKYLKDT